MKDFFLIDHQIQPIRHCIPDIYPGKSNCKDERNPEYPDQDPSKRFFFHHGSSSFIRSLSAPPLSRLRCSFPKLPASLLSFPLCQTVIPSHHRNRYQKRRGSFFAPLLLCDAFLFSPCQFFLILPIHPAVRSTAL